ncbi:MAG: hypothetical protein ACJ77K_14005 [Bacteroidia bacterium]|jgi:hypothetical protein
MKKNLVLALILCTFLYSPAQNFIKGSVIDSASVPIPYCAMGLLNAKDSSLVKGNITDDSGQFI